MYQARLGYRVGVTRGASSGDRKAIVPGIQMRTTHEVADRLWILAACDSLADARYLESYFAAQYGLPTMVFHVRGRRMALTQGHVDRLYQDVDTRVRAERSEEHTSELQSRLHLVCRLLLEKKNEDMHACAAHGYPPTR